MRHSALLFLTFLGAACQVQASDNSGRIELSPDTAARRANEPLFGDWIGLPTIQLADGTAHTIFRIEPGRLSLLRTCNFEDGTVVKVQTSTDVDIGPGSIAVPVSVENAETDDAGGHECTVALDAGVLGWRITPDELRLLLLGEFFNLTKVSNPVI